MYIYIYIYIYIFINIYIYVYVENKLSNYPIEFAFIKKNFKPPTTEGLR